jgi:FKBP-type peptidyl-prolyl cis-trans isomerase
MMRREEKSLFIIPSGLAFGQGGSSTGIVPAFTSVIFEVEIIDVKPGKL